RWAFCCENAGSDILDQLPSWLKGLEVKRNAAAHEVSPGPLFNGPLRKELGGLLKAKRLEQNLSRPAAKERGFASQHGALHEAEVGAAKNEHEAGPMLPLLVP